MIDNPLTESSLKAVINQLLEDIQAGFSNASRLTLPKRLMDIQAEHRTRVGKVFTRIANKSVSQEKSIRQVMIPTPSPERDRDSENFNIRENVTPIGITIPVTGGCPLPDNVMRPDQ